jgi:rubrerythrin
VQDAGVELQGAEMPTQRVVPPLDDPGFVDFVVTGTDVSGEFRCADCGYGAIIQRALPQCPMCAGTVWERRARLVR